MRALSGLVYNADNQVPFKEMGRGSVAALTEARYNNTFFPLLVVLQCVILVLGHHAMMTDDVC